MSKSIVIRHVNCKYGSPMGRSNERIGGKCRLVKVPMVDGGYDRGGAYWGYGVRLWVCESADGSQFFVRASTREQAKTLIVDDMLSENVTFYRQCFTKLQLFVIFE